MFCPNVDLEMNGKLKKETQTFFKKPVKFLKTIAGQKLTGRKVNKEIELPLSNNQDFSSSTLYPYFDPLDASKQCFKQECVTAPEQNSAQFSGPSRQDEPPLTLSTIKQVSDNFCGSSLKESELILSHPSPVSPSCEPSETKFQSEKMKKNKGATILNFLKHPISSIKQITIKIKTKIKPPQKTKQVIRLIYQAPPH